MTPQELADDVTAERDAEYGDQFGFPSKYFNLHVFVSQPGGSTVQRSPRYCATDFGAQAIQGVLADAGYSSTIISGWARPQAGGFTDSQQVPFLQFESGTVNAALMLEHFTHGYPGELALQAAIDEIGS